MREKLELLIKSILEQMREVKVVIFREKARNPIGGMTGWLEILRDVRFNRKQDI
jgi:hypothetical protein